MSDQDASSMMKEALLLQGISVEFQKRAEGKQPDLRDLFAMTALQGLLSGGDLSLRRETTAGIAYEYADAMMAARKQTKKKNAKTA